MFRRFILGATAGLALAAGLVLPAAASVHPNATSACGVTCQDVSGALYGPDYILNATNLGGSGPFQGRKINLRLGSNSFANEDFLIRTVASLHQMCTASGGDGEVASTSYACLTLLPLTPNAPVFQARFAPNSVQSNFCAGPVAPVDGFKLRLEPCGTVRTYFIEDLPDAVETSAGEFVPLIYAADTRGTNPLVVKVLSFSHRPARQVVVSQLVLSGSDHPVLSELVARPVLNGPFPGSG